MGHKISGCEAAQTNSNTFLIKPGLPITINNDQTTTKFETKQNCTKTQQTLKLRPTTNTRDNTCVTQRAPHNSLDYTHSPKPPTMLYGYDTYDIYRASFECAQPPLISAGPIIIHPGSTAMQLGLTPEEMGEFLAD